MDHSRVHWASSLSQSLHLVCTEVLLTLLWGSPDSNQTCYFPCGKQVHFNKYTAAKLNGFWQLIAC